MRPTTTLLTLLASLWLGVTGCGSAPGEDGDDVDQSAAEPAIGARGLRLLTRGEYERSVHDLFFYDNVSGGSECSALSECDFREASCVGGACVADPCGLVTFVLLASPGQYASVTVAGSFNDWSASAPGWAMSYDAAAAAWLLKQAVSDGAHSYKLVVDGQTWLADPENTSTAPDGFGGVNSLLDQSCQGAPSDPGADPGAAPVFSEDFPVESRPEGFPFDNSADAGLVTAVHAEQYFRAAKRVAELASNDLPALLTFAPSSKDDPRLLDFVERIGRRAYRRPLSGDERARFEGLIAAAPDVATGIARVLRVMLSSASFLYRSELGEETAPGLFVLTPHEIATALSYTYWGTTPDDELLDAADAGELADDEGIAAQAERLLASPRARDVFGAFALDWLGVSGVAGIDKGTRDDGFDLELSQEMVEETRAFVTRVLLDEGDFGALFAGDRTQAGPRLMQWYGADESGLLPVERRAGLLGQGSVLSAYAHSNQTSPVRRGLFVRRRLMCMELGAPPANAGAVPEVDPDASTRERFQQHASDPTCNSCHQHIDPIGFGFEQFDEVGHFRETDAGKSIDASGTIGYLGGWQDAESQASFGSLPELAAILADSAQVRRCFVMQSLRHATGRLETEADEPAIAALLERFDETGGDARAVWLGLSQAQSFKLRRAQ